MITRLATNWEVYTQIDRPMMHVLHRMQRLGVRVDAAKIAENTQKLRAQITLLEGKLVELVGRPINPKSPKQMVAFLYGKDGLNLPTKYKRGTLTPSVDEDTLNELYAKTQHPAIALLLEIRQQRTLIGLLDMQLSPDGCIRTSYGVTETGRLSSSKDAFGVGANLQNIPKRKGKWFREVFIPRPGKVWLKADLKQADARTVAWLSQDPKLIEIFRTGQDIHRMTAALIFDAELAAVTDLQRSLAKNCVHALNYGLGPKKFAKMSNITEAQAQRVSADYMRAFPNIRSVFQANIEAQLRRNRTLTNPFGRRRVFFDRWGDDLLRDGYAYIPQSTTADYINAALAPIEAELPPSASLLLQVHDEIDLECAPEDATSCASILRKYIERPVLVGTEPMIIPLDISIGPDWSHADTPIDAT